MQFSPIFITLQLAVATTLILLIIGVPLSWWLARTHSRFKAPVAALVAMPLVLPPTVLGFYLLILLGPQGPVGQMMLALGLETLPFTFAGLVVASVLYSLPFMVQPLQAAFETVSKGLWEAAATLRASPLDRFFSVVLPLSRAGLISAMVLTFAHTIGEFGVVLMIGGNIPGQTKVLSTAVYDHVEAMEYSQAHELAAGLLLFSFLIMLLLYAVNQRLQRGKA
jgi:molybdate transport system permease protein